MTLQHPQVCPSRNALAAGLIALDETAVAIEHSLAPSGADPDMITDEANARVAVAWSVPLALVRFSRRIAVSDQADADALLEAGIKEANPHLIDLGHKFLARYKAWKTAKESANV